MAACRLRSPSSCGATAPRTEADVDSGPISMASFDGVSLSLDALVADFAYDMLVLEQQLLADSLDVDRSGTVSFVSSLTLLVQHEFSF